MYEMLFSAVCRHALMLLILQCLLIHTVLSHPQSLITSSVETVKGSLNLINVNIWPTLLLILSLKQTHAHTAFFPKEFKLDLRCAATELLFCILNFCKRLYVARI